MSGKRYGAWSTLRTLLAERNLTVLDLHEKVRSQGFEVNKKSLYRLAASRPIHKVDMDIARAVCEALGIELGDLIQWQEPRLVLRRLDRKSEKELDRLMDKNNQAKLREKERSRFEELLRQVQEIALYNSKILVDQKRSRQSKQSNVLMGR
jgi:DNA-binding Xre family transcriptional regulator